VTLSLAFVVLGCSPQAASQAPSQTSAVTFEPASPSPIQSPSSTGTVADVALETIVDDLISPIGVVDAPGDAVTRSYIVEQTGRVLILENEQLLPTPLLDLSERLVRLNRDYDERGLLGLAFHPDFAANGRVYVYYSAPAREDAPAPKDHTNRLSEFRVGLDADVADPGSERVILEFEQPQPNHSGGALGFGPDGFLYLGTGDGGGRGDADPGHSEQGNAQDLAKLNGKILRLDVDSTAEGPYGIPPDNPFKLSDDSQPPIYAFGFRNPWRLTWEPDGDRRLLVSDVGYGRYEEIDAVEKGGNYGWRIREGAHCLDIENPLEEVTGCPTSDEASRPLIDPVIEYSHQEVGVAVVGGYVYRGSAIPQLQGRYVFGDYTPDWTTPEPEPHGSLLVAQPGPSDGQWPWRQLTVAGDALNNFFVTGMGEDATGELYVLARRVSGPTRRTGIVFRVAPVS
jgi:glucose/arabinose dehydrogenase